MTQSPAPPKLTKPTKPIRVLVDLKPALDGYAGIPQESRLLYRGLSAIEGLHTEGLIQHGGRSLRAALRARDDAAKEDRRINRLSRFVVSLYEKPNKNWLEIAQDRVDKLFARQWMRAKTQLGLRLRMSRFESELFEDFVWRTFFSKTLNPADKQALQGANFRVLTEARSTMHQAGLAGLKYFQKPSYPRIDTRAFDCFLTQTPFPGRVHPDTAMVVRYHDAVPILMPHTISDKAFHQASHYQALKDNVRQGAWLSCISHATRADLLQIFPEAEARSSVIHNIVSDEYFVEASPPAMAQQIVRNRLASEAQAQFKLPLPPVTSATSATPAAPMQYLLMVSTIEPRKNHLLLMQAWEQLKYTSHPELKIIFVGNVGWDQRPVLNAFKPWAERGDLFWLSNVPSAELRVLYRHAAVTVCPGLAEGFDYSGVEAMKCGGIVAASDIPVHREIYQDASVYFSAYDAQHAASVIASLLCANASSNDDIYSLDATGKALQSAQTSRTDALRRAGARVAALYSAQTIMPLWAAFFAQLHASRS